MRKYYDEESNIYESKNNFSYSRLSKKYGFNRDSAGDTKLAIVDRNYYKKLFPNADTIDSLGATFEFNDTSSKNYEDDIIFKKIETYMKGFEFKSEKEYQSLQATGTYVKGHRCHAYITIRVYFNKEDNKIAIIYFSDYRFTTDNSPAFKTAYIRMYDFNEDYEIGYRDGIKAYLNEESKEEVVRKLGDFYKIKAPFLSNSKNQSDESLVINGINFKLEFDNDGFSLELFLKNINDIKKLQSFSREINRITDALSVYANR